MKTITSPSKTLDFAFSLAQAGEIYSDITAEQLKTLKTLATTESIDETPGDEVYPPATHAWDIGLYLICVYVNNNTRLISIIA